jgi:hypothetical protein
MTRAVDHVTVAGGDLDALRSAFESRGFETVYGGAHDNGVTHMAVVGFEDHSYVELIAKRSDEPSPWWDAALDGEAGPCAWAVPSADIEAEAERLVGEGFSVDGPEPYARERPDGTLAEWFLADVGGGSLGAPYPMLIADQTPLDHRVTVTSTAASTGIDGLDTVVVATRNGSRLAGRFERFFETTVRSTREEPAFDARLWTFEDAPVAVAQPLGTGTWVAERLDRFGTLPCGYLFGTSDVEDARDRLSFAGSTAWGTDRVHWLDLPLPGRYGVVASPSESR